MADLRRGRESPSLQTKEGRGTQATSRHWVWTARLDRVRQGDPGPSETAPGHAARADSTRDSCHGCTHRQEAFRRRQTCCCQMSSLNVCGVVVGHHSAGSFEGQGAYGVGQNSETDERPSSSPPTQKKKKRTRHSSSSTSRHPARLYRVHFLTPTPVTCGSPERTTAPMPSSPALV